MKKFMMAGLVSLFASSYVFAQATDLTLPGERWISKFNKYVCDAYGPGVSNPKALDALKVTFEQVTTDYTLDNALLKATFEENGVLCRYNAILFADNKAQTTQLVQSIAYNPSGGATAYRDCTQGKATLDSILALNKYLYYSDNLAIMMPSLGAQADCGTSAKVVGANFAVVGKVNPVPATPAPN